MMILRRVSRLRSDFVSSVRSRRNRSARILSASLVLAAISCRRSLSFTIWIARLDARMTQACILNPGGRKMEQNNRTSRESLGLHDPD